MAARRIFKYDFAALTTTTTVPLNPDDLSRASQLLLSLQLTTIGTAAGDKLDIRLQDTVHGTIWNTRARFTQVIGTDSASTSAPKNFRMALTQAIALEDPEEGYETTGSSGGTDLPARSVRNGPFPGVLRTSTGRGSSWRVTFTVTSATSPTFTGNLTIDAVTAV